MKAFVVLAKKPKTLSYSGKLIFTRIYPPLLLTRRTAFILDLQCLFPTVEREENAADTAHAWRAHAIQLEETMSRAQTLADSERTGSYLPDR